MLAFVIRHILLQLSLTKYLATTPHYLVKTFFYNYKLNLHIKTIKAKTLILYVQFDVLQNNKSEVLYNPSFHHFIDTV